MRKLATALLASLSALHCGALAARPPTNKPGIVAVQRPIASLPVLATLPIAKTADWIEVTQDAVWVAGAKPNVVRRINSATNKVVATLQVPGEPCAGIAAAFGSIWVPFCGRHAGVARIDPASGRTIAKLRGGPGREGGIAASADSIWFTRGSDGTLVRVDPTTNMVRQTIHIPSGSHNPVASGDQVWVTSGRRNLVTGVDARTGTVFATMRTGPKPRFLTLGGGSVWVLNQGDGSVTRVDAGNRRIAATIPLGIPGHGGDITYGGGRVWATSRGIPLTEVDPATNQVTRQWIGPGGDSLRFGQGAIWMTVYGAGTLSRYAALPRKTGSLSTVSDVPARSPQPPVSATALVGTWRLLSYIEKSADGRRLFPFGKKPLGQFVFTDDRHAAISIMRNPRGAAAPADPDMERCVPEYYCSYFGTYTVDADRGSWTIHVVGSNISTFIGTDRRQVFRIEGDRLILTEYYRSRGRPIRSERILERAR